MIKETVSIDDAIALLNSMLECDPSATKALVEGRVFCNQILADHPTIQVLEADHNFEVGLLGVVNGLFGVDEKLWGAIAAKYADDGKLVGFERTENFQVS